MKVLQNYFATGVVSGLLSLPGRERDAIFKRLSESPTSDFNIKLREIDLNCVSARIKSKNSSRLFPEIRQTLLFLVSQHKNENRYHHHPTSIIQCCTLTQTGFDRDEIDSRTDHKTFFTEHSS